MPSRFDIVIGVDMETDIGSFTDYYNGVQKGTPRLLEMFSRHGVQATFFWTGHAAENNPEVVRAVHSSGHETGCHSLYHETLGDPLFPLPNNWPVCD
ncbi:MAG TPA: polysaccharide deacetylase family protein, partial [Lentisphaeria bacterium]|nr:polysaccharide deacetylase family protein [Lentisphaeria bacterium]